MGGEILINREQIDNLLTHIRERNLAPTKPPRRPEGCRGKEGMWDRMTPPSEETSASLYLTLILGSILTPSGHVVRLSETNERTQFPM